MSTVEEPATQPLKTGRKTCTSEGEDRMETEKEDVYIPDIKFIEDQREKDSKITASIFDREGYTLSPLHSTDENMFSLIMRLEDDFILEETLSPRAPNVSRIVKTKARTRRMSEIISEG